MKTTQQGLLDHARSHLHLPRSVGERAADGVAAAMGSWRFIGLQTLFVAIWIVVNLLAFAWHWDPYPFILLNLLFSTQAAYAAPVIMMSQNRQASIDRKRDDHEADEVAMLVEINRRQLEILELLHLQQPSEAEIRRLTAEGQRPGDYQKHPKKE